jgi:hypothetical protein
MYIFGYPKLIGVFQLRLFTAVSSESDGGTLNMFVAKIWLDSPYHKDAATSYLKLIAELYPKLIGVHTCAGAK